MTAKTHKKLTASVAYDILRRYYDLCMLADSQSPAVGDIFIMRDFADKVPNLIEQISDNIVEVYRDYSGDESTRVGEDGEKYSMNEPCVYAFEGEDDSFLLAYEQGSKMEPKLLTRMDFLRHIEKRLAVLKERRRDYESGALTDALVTFKYSLQEVLDRIDRNISELQELADMLEDTSVDIFKEYKDFARNITDSSIL